MTDVAWADDVELQVSQSLAEWTTLKSRDKIDQVRARARIPDGTDPAVPALSLVTGYLPREC